MTRRWIQFDTTGEADTWLSAQSTALGYPNAAGTTAYGARSAYGSKYRVPIESETFYQTLSAGDKAKCFDDFQNAITLTSPKAYQVFQRDITNRANIVISGTYSGFNSGPIEASWNGGAYQRISSNLTPGAFSLSIPNQTGGQGTLTIRPENDTAATVTVAYVGIGDVFLLAGQSNSNEIATNSQTATHATLKACVFNRNTAYGTWADASGSKSMIPLMATTYMASQGVPCGFIFSGIGGTVIANWSPTDGAVYTPIVNGDPFGAGLTYYNRMLAMVTAAGCGGVKCILWHQGENDASAGTLQATYQAGLQALATAAFNTLGVPLLPCKLQVIRNLADVIIDTTAVNAAIAALWASGTHILTGPDFSAVTADLDSWGKVHLKSDANMTSVASGWWTAITGAYGCIDPSSVPGLVLRLEASSLTYANDASVETWESLVGGAIYSQSTAVEKPTMKTNWHGLKAVYFDQASSPDNDFFTGNNAALALLKNVSAAAGFFVAGSDSTRAAASASILAFSDGDSTSNYRYLAQFNSSTSFILWGSRADADTMQSHASTAGTHTEDVVEVFMQARDYANQSSRHRLPDGAESASTKGTAGSTTDNTNSQLSVIGGYGSDGASSKLKGWVSRVLLYTTMPDASTRAAIQLCLKRAAGLL